MSELKFGQIICGHAEKDAVHMAVAPVVAVHEFNPGQRVQLDKDGGACTLGVRDDGIGIVDPFLKRKVQPGERFWLFLYPGTITSLRHEWRHPEFPETNTPATIAKDRAEKWLRNFFERLGQDFESGIRSVEYALEHNNADICFGDDFNEYPDDDEIPTFWSNWHAYTGYLPSDKLQASTSFRCAC